MKMSLPMAMNIHMAQKKRIKRVMEDDSPDSTEMLMKHPHADMEEREMHQSIADAILSHKKSNLMAKGGQVEDMTKENDTFKYDLDDGDNFPMAGKDESEIGDAGEDADDMEMRRSEADGEHEKMSMIDKIRMRRKMYR